MNTTSTGNQHQLASSTTGKPRDTPSTKSTGSQQCPANSTPPAVLGLPRQCNLCDRKIPGKNFFQHCQNSQHKKQEKFRLGPKEDLLRFLSMNYKRGVHGDRKPLDGQGMCGKTGGKPEDSCPGPCNAYKKVHYEYIGSQDGKPLDEQRMCGKVWG